MSEPNVPEAPPEVYRAMAAFARRHELLTVQIQPWAAWQVVLVCQLFARNPHLTRVLRPAVEAVGRATQAAIAAAVPEAAGYLESGWKTTEEPTP